MPNHRNAWDQLDSMSTDELRSYLEQDLEENSEPDNALRAAQILAERSSQQPSCDMEKAWESFCEVYRPFQNDPTPLFDWERNTGRRSVWRRTWVKLAYGAAAAVVILAAAAWNPLGSTTVPEDPYQQLIQWNSRFMVQIETNQREKTSAKSGSESQDDPADSQVGGNTSVSLGGNWSGSSETSVPDVPEEPDSQIRTASAEPEGSAEEEDAMVSEQPDDDEGSGSAGPQGETAEGSMLSEETTDTATDTVIP